MSEEARGDATAAGPSSGKMPSPSSAPKKGLLSRLWYALFSRRGDDYEKKLQYLSKEEAAVHARMKRRAHRWRKTARNIILFSVAFEVAAIAYAVITTRSPDLSWQKRATCVFPMFALPALSFAIYSMLGSLTRMLDRKDQKTLERLRMERQAKIDELKERTNFYATQQLIQALVPLSLSLSLSLSRFLMYLLSQRYDLDPAAKAAAATVLASKLGAETGLKLYMGDDSKVDPSPEAQRDSEVAQSAGLRNRKHPHRRTQSTGSNTAAPALDTGETSPAPLAQSQAQISVEHYQGTGTDDGGWITRIAAMLVGEDPAQSYALICGNCRRHNGLARKEDFPYITYFCPHCHALNGPRREDEHGPGLASDAMGPVVPSDGRTEENVGGAVTSGMENKAGASLKAVSEELPDEITDGGVEESKGQAK